jgi:hypothetical protein
MRQRRLGSITSSHHRSRRRELVNFGSESVTLAELECSVDCTAGPGIHWDAGASLEFSELRGGMTFPRFEMRPL